MIRLALITDPKYFNLNKSQIMELQEEITKNEEKYKDCHYII